MRYIGTHIELNVNDLKVCYTDEGPDDAPVLIFIHGFPLNKSMWNKQVEALIENYRVIAYDIRGFGNSDAGALDFSIELFVSDLLALMDALKIQQATLCGLSMGGYIALNAIENFPKRFNALVLCDTTCLADSAEVKENRMRTIDQIREYGLENYSTESLKNLFAPESYVTNKEQIETTRAMIRSTSEKSLTKTLFALIRRHETCSILPGIHVPVLILVGKEDRLTPPELAQRMHEKIKGSLLHIVSHAGHLCNLENSYEFNEQLEEFLISIHSNVSKRKINPISR